MNYTDYINVDLQSYSKRYCAIDAVLCGVDKLSIDNIKEILKLQKEFILSISTSYFDYHSLFSLRDAIEDYLLSDQDITKYKEFFADNVNYNYVCELRSELLNDMLAYHKFAIAA